MKNTFDYLIPARDFINNGGNIMKKQIVTSYNMFDVKYGVETFEKRTILFLKNGEKTVRTHIDLCWVVAKVSV
jgi:hypothetical protein